MSNWEMDARFEVVHKQDTFATSMRVLVDRETGVQYLYWAYGSGGGLTVLVDRDGKPLLYDKRG